MYAFSYFKKFLWWIFLLNPIDLISLLIPRPRNSKATTLLIRLEAIGDFVLWGGAASDYAHHRVNVCGEVVILLANKSWARLAKSLGVFTRVIELDRLRYAKNPLYRLAINIKVRRLGATKTISSVLTRDFIWCDSIVRICGAKERLGSKGLMNRMSTLQEKWSSRWYTALSNPLPSEPSELLQTFHFFRTSFEGLREPHLLELPVRGRLPEPLKLKSYYVIVPGSLVPYKRWPVKRFAKLWEQLAAVDNTPAVICGAPEESKVAAELNSLCGGRLIDLTGKTDLQAYIEVIRGAKFLIGNDSSAVHIAATCQTPSLAILGGAHIGRFLPYSADVKGCVPPRVVFHKMDCFGCEWNCIYGLSFETVRPCVDGITVDAVSRELMSISEPKVN